MQRHELFEKYRVRWSDFDKDRVEGIEVDSDLARLSGSFSADELHRILLAMQALKSFDLDPLYAMHPM